MTRPLLDGLRVLELGESLAVSVCGRMFAELGAEVLQLRLPEDQRPPTSREARLAREVTDALKREAKLEDLAALAADADLVLVGGQPGDLEARGWLPDQLRATAPSAVIAAITPFGLTGPHRDWLGNDLVTFHASGVARLLLGPVEDAEAEPPVRAAGEQSQFIAGIAAACAAMQALYAGGPVNLDISGQEAMAILPAREHSMPGYGMLSLSREKRADVLGASYILPTSDGYVAISPREEHQWAAWREVMGQPSWADDPRFATHAQRLQAADELFPFMSNWTSQHPKAEVAALAQAAHIPAFAVNGPLDVLGEAQIAARDFLAPLAGAEDSDAPLVPRGLFGLPATDYRDEPAPEGAFTPRDAPFSKPGDGPLPLSGIRVLDLSWVIAGPTTSRYLAALGADVVKVEAPTRPDPGHRSELHAVLGRGKRDLAIDLKAPGGIEAVRRLAAQSDIVVENFATGALERLGLGYEVLQDLREDVILLSASGLGRTGPDAGAVAYGTLVQCFAGFADLNGYEGRPPATGFAWSDPVLGLLLPFAATAALARRDRTGSGSHIDLAMSEALLWSMPGTLLEAQRDGKMPRRLGNTSRDFYPHDLYPAAGRDQWVAIAITEDAQWRALCAAIEPLGDSANLSIEERRARSTELDAAIAGWTRDRDAREVAARLQAAGVPASASMDGTMLFEDEHLWQRGFYESVVEDDGEARAMVGLPWRWEGGTRTLPRAPRLGANNHEILRELAGLSDPEIAALEAAGALGGADAAG